LPTSETSESRERLFVPLATEPYRWFREGSKHWELRRNARQYSDRHVVCGRRVELRRGYSSRRDALWGTIEQVALAPSIAKFFKQVPFQQVMPTARTEEEAIAMAGTILRIDARKSDPVIGFRVLLDK
jgi:hypothetical protein